MPQTTTATANKIVWVELSTPDAAAARDFYAKLFGWRVEVNPDPQYGGYALAKVGDADVAGIGPAVELARQEGERQLPVGLRHAADPDVAEVRVALLIAAGAVVVAFVYLQFD